MYYLIYSNEVVIGMKNGHRIGIEKGTRGPKDAKNIRQSPPEVSWMAYMHVFYSVGTIFGGL